MRRSFLLTLSAVLLAACSDRDATPVSSGEGSSSSSVGESGSTAVGSSATTTSGSDGGQTTSSSGGSSSSASASTGSVDSSSTAQADTSTGDAGCTPVDLLFLVDNSGSMGNEQLRIFADLEILADGIAPFDPHVMVIDSDAFAAKACEEACTSECLDGGVCDFTAPSCIFVCATADLCEDYTCGEKPDACDVELGAGVVDPIGPDTAGPCNFATGARYFDADEPDFAATLVCAASVGTGSTTSTEQVGNALASAVSASEPTATCNAGFLRPEASLAIVFITDEADEAGVDSTGTPAGWYQALLSAKGGDPSRLMAAGIIAGTQPDPTCLKNEDPIQPTPRLVDFLEQFGDNGIEGDVCSDSYEPTLQELVALIEANACE